MLVVDECNAPARSLSGLPDTGLRMDYTEDTAKKFPLDIFSAVPTQRDIDSVDGDSDEDFEITKQRVHRE